MPAFEKVYRLNPHVSDEGLVTETPKLYMNKMNIAKTTCTFSLRFTSFNHYRHAICHTMIYSRDINAVYSLESIKSSLCHETYHVMLCESMVVVM